MKKLLILIILLSVTNLFAIGERKSVVKIYTTYQKHSYVRPWSMQAVSSRTGSGCIISENRVMTNAHVVSDATFIEVRKADSPKKYIAKVKFIAHDCDLAVLDVEEKEFFKGSAPLGFGNSLTISDNIKAYGFPRGGNKITATTGIISRIEKRLYAHSRRYYLLAQTDAAINPGNSGGPILKDDLIVGIAVQTQSGQNISYMVPLPIIKRFMVDISDGKYDGIPDIGVYYQKLRNPTMRESYNLPKKETGVFVNDIVYKGSADGVLIPGDIILEIDGKQIADDGTTVLGEDDRFNFGIMANFKQLGEKLKVKIWRNGSEILKEISLKKSHYLLLDKEEMYLFRPDYYIYRGLAYLKLNRNDKVIEDLSIATKLDPSLFTSFAYLGVAYTRTGEFTNAIQTLENAIKLFDEDALTFYYLGLANYSIKDWEKANTAFTSAINLNLQNSLKNPVNALRGESRFYLGDYIGVIEDLNVAITLSPNDSELLYLIGKAQLEIGEEKDAQKNLLKANQLGSVKAKVLLETINNL
ncbi:trypsin-like peptidase domain-containing protein [bacterium]|nr:trypsin-like peptidase domain-containing protein [bacterium]